MSSLAFVPAVPLTTSISVAVEALTTGSRRSRRRPDVANGARTMAAETAVASSIYASKFDLRRFAEMRLASLVSQGACEYTQESRERLNQMLTTFLEDGGPTPQVGSTPTRAVEIQWLCNGELVSAIVEQDGYLSVLAERANGQHAFEVEIDPEKKLSPQLISEIRSLLRSMSQHVRARPGDWPSSR